jgi:hypothetical protein
MMVVWCAWHPMYRRRRRLLRIRFLGWGSRRRGIIISHGICRACLERTLLAAGRRGTR